MEAITDYFKKLAKGEKDGLTVARMLNSEPSPSWVKVHPYIRDYKYVPIEIQRNLAAAIFERADLQVVSTTQELNAIVCHVRLTVYEGGQIARVIDGTGASGLQTDKGAGALDFSKLKANALEMAVPKARTAAIKNAYNDLGRIFGSDLNKDAYADIYGASLDVQGGGNAIEDTVQSITDIADLTDFYKSLSKGLQMLHKEAFGIRRKQIEKEAANV